MIVLLTAVAVALSAKFAPTVPRPVVPDTTYTVPGLPANHGPYTGNVGTIIAHLQVREQAVASPPPRSHPYPFADRDRFLADLFGPQVEWLPPRSATREQWREWCLAAAPTRIFSPYSFSVHDGNREEWDPAFRDPWVKKWMTNPPGPSWRTLTDNGKIAGKKRCELGPDGELYIVSEY